jgi:pimeloyl-ACP methyl ester carboxylesterase
MRLLSRSLLLLFAGVVFFFLAGLVAVWAPDKPLSDLTPRWAQPPSQFVPVGTMQVHLRDEGPRDDPAPIVLLHGTSDSLHTWDGWSAALRGQRRVIRFDLPGFGLTGPDPAADYSIDAYVRFVLAVLDQLGVQEVVLGGNSLGGQIAWQTAHAQPQRVRQLLLVDASGYPLPPREVPLGFRVATSWPLSLLFEWVLPRGLVLSSLRNVVGDPDRVTADEVDRYYDMALRAGNRRALAQRLARPDPDQSQRIRSLRQPTLVLWGARDRLIPLESGQRFAQDIPGARLVVFEQLGHVPQQEDPQRTVAAVQRFLGITPQR